MDLEQLRQDTKIFAYILNEKRKRMDQPLEYIKGLWPCLREYIDVKDDELQKYLSNFTTWQASTVNHHAYRHGLVIHTIEVLWFLTAFKDCYNIPDYVFIAAFFHDLGKVDEYTMFGQQAMNPGFHVKKGVELYRLFCEKLKITPLTTVENCILSHHGFTDTGAEKNVETQEEKFLHTADLASCAFDYYRRKYVFDGGAHVRG